MQQFIFRQFIRHSPLPKTHANCLLKSFIQNSVPTRKSSIIAPITTWSWRSRCIDQTKKLLHHSSLLANNSSKKSFPEDLSPNEYEEIAEETLESLFTYFDELLESSPKINDGDLSYSTGVLTIKLGSNGTYVINKQTPNKQIWLSSPTSGPKRYDYINKTWIYRHDGKSLYELLNTEIPRIIGLENIDFKTNCTFGK